MTGKLAIVVSGILLLSLLASAQSIAAQSYSGTRVGGNPFFIIFRGFPYVVMTDPYDGQEFNQGDPVLIRAWVVSFYPITDSIARVTFPDMSVQDLDMVNVGGILYEVTLDDTVQAGDYNIEVRMTNSIGKVGTDDVGIEVLDSSGPTATTPVVDPNPTNTDPTVTSTITDSLNNVVGAEFYVDSDPGSGSGTVMAATDGSFDSPSEDVDGTITITSLAEGDHTVCVRGQDEFLNWGSVSCESFFIDTVDPVTTDDALPGWRTSTVTVTLYPTDPSPSSGLSDTLYCIDPVDCTPSISGTSVSVTEEGTSLVKYYSTGNADNLELTNTATVMIDTVDPSTSHSLSGTLGGSGWYVSDVQVTLECSDPTSGCDQILYCVDQTDTCTPTTSYPSPFMVTTADVNYARFHSTDIAGNQETTLSAEIKIDKTAPTSYATSPATSTDPVVAVGFVAEDPESSQVSGMAYVELFYNTGSGWTQYGSQFITSPISFDTSTTGGDSVYEFETVATDNAGNTEVQTFIADSLTTVDTTGPSTSGTTVTLEYTSTNPTVTATTTDALSNVAGAEFYVDSDPGKGSGTLMSATDGSFDSPSEAVEGVIDISSLPDGEHTVYVRAQDFLDTWGPVDSFQFTIDTTLPVLTSLSPTEGTEYIISGSTPTGDVDYMLESDDPLSEATYSIDGAPPIELTKVTDTHWESLAGNHPSLARGEHTITYSGTNLAGNYSTILINFIIILEATTTSCSDASSKLDGTYNKVTLIQDITDHVGTCITFNAGNITFDGDNHMIDGDATGVDYGIKLNGYSSLIIQDVELREFEYGIFDDITSSEVTIDNIFTHHNTNTGIFLKNRNEIRITNTTTEWNNFDGIDIVICDNNTIDNNTIRFNKRNGMWFFNNDNSLVQNNFFNLNGNSDNEYNLKIASGSNGNTIIHNNLIPNIAQAEQIIDNGINYYNDSTGGNHWDDYDEPSEGCEDTSPEDGICDNPYSIPGGSNQDNYPFVDESGWLL